MECRSGGDVDDYLYLDPKLLKGGDVVPKNRAPFQDAIVFVVGGGNYIEYQNLVDYIKVSIFFLVLRLSSAGNCEGGKSDLIRLQANTLCSKRDAGPNKKRIFCTL
jgi:hypothetical protein